MSLIHDLTKHIKMGLEIVDQTTETEYGVDTEREMAASEQTLDNAALAAAASKDTADKLEIPSFLKRS